MTKYHFNRETGKVGKCTATFRCPLGGDKDHYATEREAAQAYERFMESSAEAKLKKIKGNKAKTLGDPIIHTKGLPFYSFNHLGDAMDYDYEYYYDHSEDHPGDMCRCGRIEDFVFKGWLNGGEDLANMVKKRSGIPEDEPLPSDWVEALRPYVERPQDFDFEPMISSGYYGEEFDGVTIPSELKKLLNDFYYAAPNAEGPHKILSYLRGKGYDTTGDRPLEAIKNALRAENKGKLSAKVAKARAWKVSSISLANISLPSPSQAKEGEDNPRPIESPYPKNSDQKTEIAGVVFETADKKYELVDGYHRIASLKKNGKRRGTYIVLTANPPRPFFNTRWDNDPWERE